MSSSTERKARNEAIFRDANDEIAAARGELTSIAGKTPFLCECDDIAPGPVPDRPTTCPRAREVVAESDGYVVVEKRGDARRVAVETDPRGSRG